MRILIFSIVMLACTPKQQQAKSNLDLPASTTTIATDTIIPATYDAKGYLIKVTKTEDEWRTLLLGKEFNVLRQEGTEYAFSGDLLKNHEKGLYICHGCKLPLFSSDTKFDSGTGWPSFYQPFDKAFVTENTDGSHGMTRVEVECARCGGHQGHVFDDGPQPTGLRYCINSVSLDFVKQ